MSIQRMNPQVEVVAANRGSLRTIGQIPPAVGGDKNPSWNQSVDEDVELGEELQFKVFHHRAMPFNKDVEIGKGSFALSAEIFARSRHDDIDVKLYKGNELTGSLQIRLDLLHHPEARATVQTSQTSTRSVASQEDHRASEPNFEQNHVSSTTVLRPDTTQSRLEERVLPFAQGDQGFKSSLPRHADAGPAAALLVAHQYWDREPRSRHRCTPVFCTSALRRWLAHCCCCCCCHCCCGHQGHASKLPAIAAAPDGKKLSA